MVLVKRTPSLANYKGPLSSKIFDESGEEANTEGPVLQLKENPHSFELEIGVPGLNDKDFRIIVENGSLLISSEKFATEEIGREGKVKISVKRECTDEDASSAEESRKFTVL